MNRKTLLTIIGTGIVVTTVSFSVPSFAQDDVAALKKQIEALQKKVDALEAQTPQAAPDTGRDPFEEMGRMHDQMNQMFQNAFSQGGPMNQGMFSSQMSFNPNLNIEEKDDQYVVVFDMTGLDKENVDIQIHGQTITVKGEKRNEETQQNKDQYFSAQTYGSFLRTIPLPEDADTTKVKTEKQGDQLIITVPKKSD